MEYELKKQLRDKAQLSYGLLNALKCDIDILRKDVNDFRLSRLEESVRNTDETLQKLLLIVEELEYILKLDKIQGP